MSDNKEPNFSHEQLEEISNASKKARKASREAREVKEPEKEIEEVNLPPQSNEVESPDNCPDCRATLFERTDVLLTSNPPRVPTVCRSCGYRGSRRVDGY